MSIGLGMGKGRTAEADDDGSEAIWQEMQSALAEVELSAVLSNEHVFGDEHSEALDDLRTRQLKLAQAWARSEAGDEVVLDMKSATDRSRDRNPSPAIPGRSGGSHTQTASPSAAGGSSVGGSGKSQPRTLETDKTGVSSVPPVPRLTSSQATLDEETEKDILLARERRVANDRYFNRINDGVRDVVAKLEEVAQAMRAVERESKDIWSDSDSADASTLSESTPA